MARPVLTRVEKVLARASPARASQLESAGIHRAELSRLVAAGKIQRLARGLYALPDYQGTEESALVLVAKRVPRSVFCLLTALQMHGLTTQLPAEVWIAIGNKRHAADIDYPPLRIARFSEASLAYGVETRKVAGVPVRVTSVAKTVADCFKFRNKVGLDVALEALREARRERKMNIDELWRAAQVDRVANVMRPYLESIA